jgi:hypothetical protein
MIKPKGLILFSLVSLTTATSIPGSISEAGTLFIYYDGVISGYSLPSAEACPDAKPYYFSNQTESSMFLGVNAPWDPNPFFFSLEHYGRDYQTSKGRRDTCINAVGGCSNDPILNLDFESTYQVCHSRKDDTPCGQFERSWYYVTAQMYNLGAASITEATDDPFFSDDAYHVVTGDYHSWVSNGTIQSGVDVRLPRNYSASEEKLGHCGNVFRMDWYASLAFPGSQDYDELDS